MYVCIVSPSRMQAAQGQGRPGPASCSLPSTWPSGLASLWSEGMNLARWAGGRQMILKQGHRFQ